MPVAFASYSIRSEKNIFREFAICSDTPLRCMLDAKVVWAPKPQFTRRAFADSIPVPDNDRLRLRMMKRLAERFKSGNKRVLPTPLHRYQSANQQVIDGAVFTLSDTNDPEMLILIEAVRDNDNASPSWRYTLARMNSQPQQVHYEGELVWDLKGYWGNPRGPEDPYVEVQDSLLPPELSLQ